jgi:hypothetical protein
MRYSYVLIERVVLYPRRPVDRRLMGFLTVCIICEDNSVTRIVLNYFCPPQNLVHYV